MEGGSALPPVSAAVRASLLSHPAERALNGEPGPIPSRRRHEASDAAPGAGRRRRAGGNGRSTLSSFAPEVSRGALLPESQRALCFLSFSRRRWNAARNARESGGAD